MLVLIQALWVSHGALDTPITGSTFIVFRNSRAVPEAEVEPPFLLVYVGQALSYLSFELSFLMVNMDYLWSNNVIYFSSSQVSLASEKNSHAVGLTSGFIIG